MSGKKKAKKAIVPPARTLEGQVAVVTGGAQGIGLAIAERLAAQGAKIVLGDLRTESLNAAAATLRDRGAEVAISAGDLSKEARAKALHAKTLTSFGPAHILINNAGGGVILPFLEHTPATLRATLDRNLWTTIWCSRVFLPDMIARSYGRIINIGADSVRNGLFDHAAYNAAKGGVHALTTGLAREFATKGVTVNTVAPCAIANAQLAHFIKTKPKLADRFLRVIPLGRAGEMDEVSSMVGYLAGPEASFVTGQVLSVNGGSTML